MHPVKSRRAIRVAYHQYGVKTFSLDSADELDKILAETGGAKDLTLIVRMAVSSEGSFYPLDQKFGVKPADAPDLLRRVRQATEELMGVSFHVGSQCMRPLTYKAAMMEVNRAIVAAGIVVDVVDIGGGFPAIYPDLAPQAPLQAYFDEIAEGFEQMYVAQNAQLWAEPGRALVAEAGSILARVELRKGDALYLNDGGYGNLFDATHVKWRFPVKLLREKASRAKPMPFRFYGPTCDSLDEAVGPFLLPADIREGDYIEIGMLGAYSTSIATNFNGFGETLLVAAKDSPWPTMFAQPAEAAPAAPEGQATGVVSLDQQRKGRRPRKS
jgi:ornithine decarboxylase